VTATSIRTTTTNQPPTARIWSTIRATPTYQRVSANATTATTIDSAVTQRAQRGGTCAVVASGAPGRSVMVRGRG